MKNSPAFQVWDERYSTDEFIFGIKPNQYLETVANKYLKPGASTLCVAEGEVEIVFGWRSKVIK